MNRLLWVDLYGYFISYIKICTIYYYYIVSLPPEAPAKISSVMNITDEVLRYLLVRKDERRAKPEAQPAESTEDTKETKE